MKEIYKGKVREREREMSLSSCSKVDFRESKGGKSQLLRRLLCCI